jgi:hypothetical protein
MSQVRNLAFDPDAGVRKAAYEAELTAWERPPSARGGLERRERRGEHARGAAGWDGGPARHRPVRQPHRPATLDAMFAAARDSFPDFRRYLRAKARPRDGRSDSFRCGGGPRLVRLFAPVGESGRDWGWDEATTFLEEQFGRYSPKMRAFAAGPWRSGGSTPRRARESATARSVPDCAATSPAS